MKSLFSERASALDYSRRVFLQSAAAATTAMLTRGAIAADKAGPMIVDSHVHFYDPTRPEGIPWPGKDNKDFYRPMLPLDFQKVGAPLGVTGVVVIEASPWLEDNKWLLDLAEKSPLILGVVGNLTPGEEKFGEQLNRFAKSPLFRGIRISDTLLKQNLDQPKFLRDVARLSDLNLELDVNGGPPMLPLVAKLAKAVPNLRIVINHATNLRIDGRPVPPEWLADMRASAEQPQVFCKVSGLVSYAPKSGVELDFYRPVLNALWQTFGTQRLIYASDWPMIARTLPYATTLELVRKYVDELGGDASERFFADNSQAAYRWNARL